ncbi:MAG: hypothetical protein JWP74_527 [Marmoricola sp.]|nr:hypothetical protein [Marmoricola sp.]
MRKARELDVLRPLKSRDLTVVEAFALSEGSVLDLAAPCTVIGGRNGTGKSRLIREIASQKGDEALLIDLHYLAEHALTVLRNRFDYNSMADEAGPFGPNPDIGDYVEAIVKRDYDSIEWFALELETENGEVDERFRWTGEPGDPALFPYFRATYRGIGYTSPHMGLGEFSVHFLFWILEHYKDKKGLLVLLDEPDAFLPPVGVASLLPHLFKLCTDRGWRLVVSTHSEEMIALAAEHQSFTLLSVNDFGESFATHSSADPSVLLEVLSRPPVDTVLFAEDEAAVALASALIEHVDPMLRRRMSIVWGGGSGYMQTLQQKLPRTPGARIRFGYLYDGDQRDNIAKSPADKWPALFLPTHNDPDILLRELGDDPERLGERLGVTADRVRRVLDRLEGKDKHDWFNEFCAEFGRPQVLAVMTSEWAKRNTEHATSFVDDLVKAIR